MSITKKEQRLRRSRQTRVRIALQGHQPFSAAVLAVYNTLKALREGTKPGDLPNIASPADLHQLSDDQLGQLAQEMRDELVRVLSIRPAHFASNLGVVELCLALHLSFDFSRDRLIWDTGHQVYPHKLITGRYQQFETIRTRGGLMGYPNPHESPYDLFMTGHAGCSVSCSLGLKVGDDLLDHGDRRSVAVIGDGALPSGIVFAVSSVSLIRTSKII